MFSQNLRELRKEKNLTQTQLAKILGVSKGTVAMWEVGQREPKFEMLKKIANLFSESTDYILGYNSELIGKESNTKEKNQKYLDSTNSTKNSIIDCLCLDEYGKYAVESLINIEKERCFKSGSFSDKKGFAVSFHVVE